MKPKLFVYDGIALRAEAQARLTEVFDIVVNEDGRVGLPEAFAEYDALWTRLGHRIGDAAFGRKVRARWLAIPMTGLAHVDELACVRHGLQVVSLRGEAVFLRSVRATAELTIGLLLALLRNIPHAVGEVQAGTWRRAGHEGREIFGKTVGLIGVGRLGLIVGEYMQALGGRPIGYDPAQVGGRRGPVEMVDDLKNLAAAADIVCVHADLNPSSRGLLGEGFFRSLKPGAVLVNTARGEIVDTTALLAALTSGHLAGAALDVLDTEPDVRPDHPLVRYAAAHPHLLLTPHIGGYTAESVEKTEAFIAAKLAALALI